MVAFKYIKAAQFFPRYAPKVKDWRHKVSGKNGKGKPVTFTDKDKEEIHEGLHYFLYEATTNL